jgi:hypothetical protein
MNPDPGLPVQPPSTLPTTHLQPHSERLEFTPLSTSGDGVGRSLHNVNSLGLSVVRAHGMPTEGASVLICNSYVNGPLRDGDVARNLLPDPSGDAYLHFTAVPTLSPRETLLSLTLQPGLTDYYQRVGLLSPEARIIEVNPDSRVREKPGYPHSDPLTLFRAGGGLLPSRDADYFIATFPTDQGRALSRQNDSLAVQHFDPADLNNKALFRENASHYGYRVLDGFTIREAHDLARINDLATGKYWLKLAGGSGGDLVRSFQTHESGDFERALEGIRQAVISAFDSAEFPEGSNLEHFWPQTSPVPTAQALVVEQDASRLGRVLINGSMNVLLKEDGRSELVDFFRQNTGADGSYLGSERLDSEILPIALHAEILQQGEKVFRYAHENGYRGYVGFDFFVVESEEGEPSVHCIELNARPTMSVVPALTAKKLAAFDSERHATYLNVNISTTAPLYSFEDFQRAVSIDGHDLTDPANTSGVTIVPLAMRSLFTHSDDGGFECLVASPKVKVLVTAPRNDEAWNMLYRLEREGRITIGE